MTLSVTPSCKAARATRAWASTVASRPSPGAPTAMPMAPFRVRSPAESRSVTGTASLRTPSPLRSTRNSPTPAGAVADTRMCRATEIAGTAAFCPSRSQVSSENGDAMHVGVAGSVAAGDVEYSSRATVTRAVPAARSRNICALCSVPFADDKACAPT